MHPHKAGVTNVIRKRACVAAKFCFIPAVKHLILLKALIDDYDFRVCSSFLRKLIMHCPSKIKVAFCRRPPFALITEHICCGIVSTTLSNATTFISIQSCINFCPKFFIDICRVKPFPQSFHLTLNTLNGDKVRTLWWLINVWKWLPMLLDTRVSSCSTLSQLGPDESCHCCPGICPSHQGIKSIARITWSLHSGTPHNPITPNPITLQFADLNWNDNSLGGGIVCYCT